MTLARDQFNQITLAPGAIAYTIWSYVDLLDHGPQYVSASFQGATFNVGDIHTYWKATTIQTSVIAVYDQSVIIKLFGIGYESQIRNDGPSAFIMKVNIGNFE